VCVCTAVFLTERHICLSHGHSEFVYAELMQLVVWNNFSLKMTMQVMK